MYSPQTTLVRGLSLKEEMITHPVKMKCHSLYTVFQKKKLDPFLLNEWMNESVMILSMFENRIIAGLV